MLIYRALSCRFFRIWGDFPIRSLRFGEGSKSPEQWFLKGFPLVHHFYSQKKFACGGQIIIQAMLWSALVTIRFKTNYITQNGNQFLHNPYATRTLPCCRDFRLQSSRTFKPCLKPNTQLHIFQPTKNHTRTPSSDRFRPVHSQRRKQEASQVERVARRRCDWSHQS